MDRYTFHNSSVVANPFAITKVKLNGQLVFPGRKKRKNFAHFCSKVSHRVTLKDSDHLDELSRRESARIESYSVGTFVENSWCTLIYNIHECSHNSVVQRCFCETTIVSFANSHNIMEYVPILVVKYCIQLEILSERILLSITYYLTNMSNIGFLATK